MYDKSGFLSVTKMAQAPQDDFTPKLIDMDEDMVEEAKKVIKEACTTLDNDEAMAKMIKLHFDEKYGKIWHCIVGESFGTFGTHETKNYLYIYYKNTAIQIWKCGYIYEKKAPTNEE